MTTGATIACPHCSAANAAGAQFCESCGKVLPTAFGGGPRVVEGSAFASTAAGQKLQSVELHKQALKAAGALLAVAIIQTIVCAILIGIAVSANHTSRLATNAAFLGIAVCAVIFWGLFFWGLRKQPLPAAIVGLILYATLVAINVVTAVGLMSKGEQGNGGIGGIGIGWLDIVILVVLARAISAGSQYRKMVQSGVAAAG